MIRYFGKSFLFRQKEDINKNRSSLFVLLNKLNHMKMPKSKKWRFVEDEI